MFKYLLAFSVYTLAMIGIIVIAFLVWKNAVLNNGSKKKNNIKVEEALNLNSRKTLYVIKIKDERFLIAADVDKTTFLAKLKNDEDIMNNEFTGNNFEEVNFKGDNQESENEIGLKKPSTMRNILKELTRNKMDG